MGKEEMRFPEAEGQTHSASNTHTKYKMKNMEEFRNFKTERST